MKNALMLILLFLSFSVSATTYYIDPSGNNSNNGSSSSPWKTLAYACSKATTSGDIIHVNAGTFIETSQCILVPGVSIVGEGNSSIIHSHFSTGNLIEMLSNSTIDGNQSISYIQMEGGTSVSDLVGNSAIKVTGRSNVLIHHCTFQHFSTMGVIFYSGANIPAKYPTGNKFYNNIMTNCSKMTPGDGNSGEGSLCIGSEHGMMVYNNTITCNLRSSGNNGYCIKYYGFDGLNKGLKIYNNTLTADQCPSTGFNFAIEMWGSAGGCEIYNNTIKGTIDIPNSHKDLSWYGVPYPEGAYSFGTKIYNNTIGWESSMPIGSGDGEFGIRLEANQEYTYIYNNHIKNVGVGIECNIYETSPVQYQNNIYIYYNIFENIGSSSFINSKGWGIRIAGAVGTQYENWNILNNVFSSKTSGGSTMYAISVPGGFDGSVVTNITIRNNIIQNFTYAAIAGLSTSYEADGVSIENNIFYNNGNNNLLRCNTTGWLHYTNQSNILGTNRLFSSSVNFNIQSNSSAIDAGLDVGLTSDYAGNAIQKPPDIGAYEFYALPLPIYQNAVVENATPSLIGITYNLTLANIVPANASFNVLVNSLTRDITSVAISGTKIQLTLASPVVYGDVVTVSYTKPSINPLQTIAGGEAANISAKAVTNNCISNVPVYSAAAVQNITPSLIEITFSLALANIVPSNSAFNVQVNSSARNITSVTISGNKVQLTLGSGVKFGDIITVSYTKPVSNPLQTSSGAQTSSISNQPVTNNCNDAIKTNNPPVVVINYAKTIYEGFVSEIDATSTYDPNNDSLIVEWTVPNNVPVSIVQSFKTEFLAPVVDNSKTVNFDLKVSDGTTILSNAIPVTVLPYKPELNEARITNIIASTYLPSDYPEYIIDGNITTKWSSDGDNQWLILTLAGPFRISHLMIAFLQEQNYESYFDIYGSKDNVIWESILTSAASCKFSGERQIFDIPALNSNSEYSYLKYVGHGNSLNSLNSVSEIKIFGTPQQGSKIIDPKGNNITIYPNPTQNFFNISINEPDYNLNSIRIIDISGKIVFEYPFDHKIDNVRLPDSLNSGVYLVEFRSGKTILDTQKLIIEK